MSSNLPAPSAVHETIRKEFPSLDAAAITKALVKGGHVADDSHLWAAAGRVKLSPLAASADQRNLPLLREVAGHCCRLGYDLDLTSDKAVDLFALDQAFAGKDVAERLRVKTALKSLHLI